MHLPDPHGYASIRDELARLQQELRELLGSWEFAFAHGHGCTIGDHPQFRATRERTAHLRARIAELTD